MDTTPVHGIPPCNGIRLTAISNEPEKYRITLASGDCLTGTAHAIAFTGSVDTPHVIDSHQALKR